MSTFQDRFKPAFDAEAKRRIETGEPKLTKTMVWKAAGASSGAFTQWYDGTTGAKLNTCFLIAPILRVDPHWLFDESKPKTEQKNPSTVTVIKPPTERDTWINELVGLAHQLDSIRLGMLIKTGRDLVAEQPAKQTPASSQ